MKGFAYLIALWLLMSCSRDADPQIMLQGTYVGSFQRDSGQPSQVELTFTGNQYSGKVTPYSGATFLDSAVPVICSGTFVVSQQTIDFQDECVYTANFDWSLILSQKWTFSINDKRLLLSRNKDRYVLTKGN